MDRREFLAIVLLSTVVGANAPDDLEIPVEMRGGRFFAVPRTLDGRTFHCWLDTDGSGFIFDDAVRAFHLKTAQKTAELPQFATDASIPLPSRNGPMLPIFTPSGHDRADPILQGFEAQLGGTWFAGRSWRLDFKNARMQLLRSPVRASAATAELELSREIYPRVNVRVGNQTLRASFDIAASLAESGDAASVRATSFVPSATLAGWRDVNPAWSVRTFGEGVCAITVPEITLGTTRLRDVEFSTRPRDDVFEGDDVQVKLGANAYRDRVVTLDYPNSRLIISA